MRKFVIELDGMAFCKVYPKLLDALGKFSITIIDDPAGVEELIKHGGPAPTALGDLVPWKLPTTKVAEKKRGESLEDTEELSAMNMIGELRMRGYSAARIAGALGVSSRSVYNWSRGRPIASDNLAALRRLYA